MGTLSPLQYQQGFPDFDEMLQILIGAMKRPSLGLELRISSNAGETPNVA